ncbi:class I adenylate-forming enzyme family protein [Streptomyces sp. MA15]|uniref:class I adenylate-forming enzyme family protein n=1 Tax=Streptomyces sp. MA15 TaxID=3055061 RepID=UPI0025B00DB2|nr:class I adenylate-forming enzyme family protein [Streptomyces sp. MA15]MDN3270106.1 class I adenylate-forming enzyme family protein [Streptomyces sp. MA15]
MSVTTPHDTLPSLLEARAATAPGRPAVEYRDTTVTWAELADRVRRARARLRRHTRTPGARLGILARNDPDTLVALLAATAEGREVVLYDGRATAAERDQVAALAGLIGWHTPSAADHADGPAEPEVPALGDPPPAPWFGLVTSGTGGLPKVVRKHWHTTIANAADFAALAGYRGDDRILCTTPVHHAYAFGVAVLPALVTGATLVFASHPAPPTTLARLLRDSRATVVQSVPFLYRAVLDSGEPAAPSALRICLSAGEPLAAPLTEAWNAATGVPLRDQYGSTEFGQIAYTTGTPGGPLQLMPGVTARLRSPDGVWLTAPDPQATGDLYLRQAGAGPVTYWGLPELTAASHCDGWFRTGDTGRLPSPGHVVVEGRTTRRISVAGRKVDPDEVERAVLQVPGVRECWVAAPPEGSPGHGDRFAAFVAVEGGVTETDVRRHVARALSPYKIPTRFHVREALPRTGTGKVHAARLWQEAAGEAARPCGQGGTA